MEPVVREVSKETGLHIELFNVNNKKGSKMYGKISLLCNTNSVPLYYNLKSGYSIVGVTTHENLRNWALGQNPSKMANVRMEELEEAAYRVTGYWGRIQRIIRQIRLKGEEKMIKRYGISDQQ
ncbi:hypothetical protein MACJ_002597 [Theileria orientalis]|uniref:Uncharacterized protein n=1 Tax=Theileria orientalis TaxID=68886 RepID=A0A976QVL6_THEOR|nr:hypothetical protein MACJ_002597 [Theileria orientalis]